MEKIFEEDKYLSAWYDWEEVYNENHFEEIDPEEIVAINKGFGLTKNSSLAGEINWNDNTKRFDFSKVKVEKSRRINFYEHEVQSSNETKIGFFKVTDLSSPDKPYYKILMKLNESQKLYSCIERNKIFRIDDTNKPIYAFNENVKLYLTNKERIVNYIIFFFLNVKGRHGRFYPITGKIDSPDNEINNFLRFALDLKYMSDFYSNVESELKTMFDPENLDFEAKVYYEKDVRFRLGQFYLIFKDSLFASEIEVTETGMVSLLNEKLVYENIITDNTKK